MVSDDELREREDFDDIIYAISDCKLDLHRLGIVPSYKDKREEEIYDNLASLFNGCYPYCDGNANYCYNIMEKEGSCYYGRTKDMTCPINQTPLVEYDDSDDIDIKDKIINLVRMVRNDPLYKMDQPEVNIAIGCF